MTTERGSSSNTKLAEAKYENSKPRNKKVKRLQGDLGTPCYDTVYIVTTRPQKSMHDRTRGSHTNREIAAVNTASPSS
ncbi:hypothetical protein BELL_0984g00020 [Botrytis elliptica]|uniref:Uncharacterized protein n=1 Tax=Botrytis elliptica TaxID=278938 RepID=A0A4Z1JAM2_9HELO|nr:hypothetical protein BELL_0984g00020 [Botrytis elliptica]